MDLLLGKDMTPQKICLLGNKNLILLLLKKLEKSC